MFSIVGQRCRVRNTVPKPSVIQRLFCSDAKSLLEAFESERRRITGREEAIKREFHKGNVFTTFRHSPVSQRESIMHVHVQLGVRLQWAPQINCRILIYPPSPSPTLSDKLWRASETTYPVDWWEVDPCGGLVSCPDPWAGFGLQRHFFHSVCICGSYRHASQFHLLSLDHHSCEPLSNWHCIDLQLIPGWVGR